MTSITEQQDRHFFDDQGRMFWINGPEDFCYISEQRQWRKGLCLKDVLLWKQCAPSGLVSQRFRSIDDALEAFETNHVLWSQDLYLKRMGEQMQEHRSPDDYRPTFMKVAELAGVPVREAPWARNSVQKRICSRAAPRCLLPRTDNRSVLVNNTDIELPHTSRRKRSKGLRG